MTEYSSIQQIPTERLTHEYWIASNKQAKLEHDWEVADHQRLAVLAEVTGWYNEGSHAANERRARIDQEYQKFLTRRADIKQALIVARAKTKAIELEIRVRLNQSYQERQEFKAGGLAT